MPNGALAYAPDGRLFVVEGSVFNGSGFTPAFTINVIEPNGTLGTPLTVGAAGTSPAPDFAGFYSVGGATWDPTTNQLLVTDGGPGNGAVYSINPSTGAATTISSGDLTIQQVTVQPGTGNLLVSDAAGPGSGGIYQVDRSTGAMTPVVSGLDYAAGLGFDSGHLIYQQVNGSSFAGQVFSAPVTSVGSPVTVGLRRRSPRTRPVLTWPPPRITTITSRATAVCSS